VIFRRRKWALQIDRIFNGVPLDPIYEVGKPSKISQLIHDIQTNPNFFAHQVEIAEDLDSIPKAELVRGNFGFVPGSEVPIRGHLTYIWDSPERRRSPHRGIRAVGYALVAAVVAFVLISAFMAERVHDGMNMLEGMAHKCVVLTKNGKPQSVEIYGKQLFYDADGEIIIPELREIHPNEKLAFDQPLDYCTVIAVDGVEPRWPNPIPKEVR
jgi:hypothetical protein